MVIREIENWYLTLHKGANRTAFPWIITSFFLSSRWYEGKSRSSWFAIVFRSDTLLHLIQRSRLKECVNCSPFEQKGCFLNPKKRLQELLKTFTFSHYPLQAYLHLSTYVSLQVTKAIEQMWFCRLMPIKKKLGSLKEEDFLFLGRTCAIQHAETIIKTQIVGNDRLMLMSNSDETLEEGCDHSSFLIKLGPIFSYSFVLQSFFFVESINLSLLWYFTGLACEESRYSPPKVESLECSLLAWVFVVALARCGWDEGLGGLAWLFFMRT